MSAFLRSWDPADGHPHSAAGSPHSAAGDEPIPSDRFRASALVDVRGLQISAGGRTDAPPLATGISLSIARGEVIGLVGVAGSGATEIALAIAGRLPAPAVVSAGSILLAGQELVGASPRSLTRLRGTSLAFVPANERTGLVFDRPIGRQLARPLRTKRGLSRRAAARRVLELLDQVGLPDPRATSLQLPAQLDPLALRRVLIADAVSCSPDLLILDEPTGTLDAESESAVLELYRELRRENGFSIIVASRDLGVVAAGCSRVAVLEAGRIVEQASAAEIVSTPQHPYTRRLVTAARTPRD
ncbi:MULTISPECIES: ATP-binding cassette domain-containing protein [Cryobacterium]|uniref:ATP-binding cassette domain-containing protein n=1 Tax=Cryobacterium TaxID=69578 RepID=UPI00141AD9A9|nr:MULTISPECIES: ATP-binding cassette domain-containing protein [Cryobacterium]